MRWGGSSDDDDGFDGDDGSDKKEITLKINLFGSTAL